ncbi:MAG: hypothetical protein B7Z78_09640 [Rhodospirillales bacterium 20-60-12]|jgi:hypothetical protein|nr:MAG: hypothetical protein B7Z78_09640 [Rhodospirillales bacterium 20-60-12]HQT68456.1 hypothetical protein [Acetobacteraceae bacterium]
MRRLILSLLMAGTYATSAAAADCVPSTQQKAIEVIGLKSSLMVGALACGQRPQYDQFMTRFQPHILAEQHVMDSYFRKLHGRLGQTNEDAYVTNLANSQSEVGITQGVVFCQNTAAVFNRVAALTTQDQLDQFAEAEPAPQPVVIVACGITESSSFARMAELAPRP